ncbi:hypothetical protein [Brevundimonas sp.]|uniref:hypothetical protein n=1 Tax=Brevundimonas sp. TaxID=1871086 RepID=UPI0028A0607C|nr:hypothetical protein [Brevundimonas sp.]
MSRYTFTAFANRTLEAKKKQEESCSYYGNHEEHGLDETTRAVAEWDKLQGKAQFWSGGEFLEKHDKKHWQGSAQITLEYARECLPYLTARLAAMPWHYTLASTMSSKGAGVLVRIPLAVRVTDPDKYTRIANFLLADIDLIGARNGTDTITFLWQWDIADLWFADRPDEGVLMEPLSYHLRNKGRQVYAQDYVGLGRPQNPHAAAPAKDDGDDLFQWGGE